MLFQPGDTLLPGKDLPERPYHMELAVCGRALSLSAKTRRRKGPPGPCLSGLFGLFPLQLGKWLSSHWAVSGPYMADLYIARALALQASQIR